MRYRVTVGRTSRAYSAPLSGGDSLFPESEGEVVASGGLVLELLPGQPESPRGGYWTPSTSGFRSAGAVYLSSVLEPASSIPGRYYLTRKACAGILRRARRRGKALPHVLEMALRLRAYDSTDLPALLEETVGAIMGEAAPALRRAKKLVEQTMDLFG